MDLRACLRLPTVVAARAQTRAEEIANTLSHAAGGLLAVLAWPLLERAATGRGGGLGAFAAGVFCATMLLQYAASAVYHGLPPGRAKLWARAVDHAAIFVFIAGSATPFTLGAMARPAGIATCVLVWILALWGASLKLRRRLTNRRLSTGLYVLLGWLALLAAWPGVRALPPEAIGWLLGGGAVYLVGTGFFVFDASLRFGHFAWHLCVLAGSGCHLCAALQPALR